MHDLVGKTVEWEASGRGRGNILRGTAVLFIPPGTSNEEALAELKRLRPDVKLRPKYIRFAPSTHQTPRYFVLVDVPTRRIRPIQYIYAPNAQEVTAVA